MSNIHWFPGHMKKALNNIKDHLKMVDLVIEICDSRAPISTIDDELHSIIKSKDHILVLSKADLADEKITLKWLDYFKSINEVAIAVDLSKEADRKRMLDLARQNAKAKENKEKKLGIKPRAIRAMIIGAPNVGKSTLINRFASKRIAKVENKPGCTRNERWIKVDDGFELLDTPGVLPMRYDDNKKAINIALLGSIKEKVLPIEELAKYLINFLMNEYKEAINNRYQIDDKDPLVILNKIATKRGYLSNNDADIFKASTAILVDFRNGKLGRITLEKPN